MKVKELIEELNRMDPELEIMKSQDDEGNGFNLVDSIELCYIWPAYLESRDYEERISSSWSNQELEEEYDITREELEKDYTKLICIW